MQILAEKQHAMGGNYVLVKYSEEFFAYGPKEDLNSFLGFPVNQCGTKEEVLDHCKLITKLCEKRVKKFKKELAREKKNPKGWQLLIEQEQSELEMLADFQSILNAI